ncbi:MAG: aspartyl protease family protein [Spirochaetota bacterium]|nr:aspartyl protease family protein [Spirochaetota bacterium]OPZ39795.1 MAG: hypothetical protein BWY96_00118 [Spirochaetes bacterium ADurb.BinA120]HPV96734.1 aspartyl protease family protein [Spirochaetota bacterium]
MIVRRSSNGLFEFDVVVIGKKKKRNLRGLIDTGSMTCACTYEVITTLQIRPISWDRVSTIDMQTRNAFTYISDIEFDGKRRKSPIIRVSSLPNGIHFILGMSILSHCKMLINGDHMDIQWK